MIVKRWIIDDREGCEGEPSGPEYAKWGILYRARAYAETALRHRKDELGPNAVIVEIEVDDVLLPDLVEEAIDGDYPMGERPVVVMDLLKDVVIAYLEREIGTLMQQAEHWAPTHPLATHHRLNKADAYKQMVYLLERGGFVEMFEAMKRPLVYEPVAYPPKAEIAGLRDPLQAADAYWSLLPETGENEPETEELKLRRTIGDLVAQVCGGHVQQDGEFMRVGDLEVWERAKRLSAYDIHRQST